MNKFIKEQLKKAKVRILNKDWKEIQVDEIEDNQFFIERINKQEAFKWPEIKINKRN